MVASQREARSTRVRIWIRIRVCTCASSLLSQRLQLVAQRQRPEDLAGHEVGADQLGRGGAGLAGQPRHERHAGAVDEVVDDLGHDDLAAQRVLADLLSEAVLHRLREVGAQVDVAVGVVGQVGVEQLVGQHDLGPRHQHRQLGHGERAAPLQPPAYLPRGRQRLELAVEDSLALELLHPVLVDVEQRRRVRDRVGEREVLLVVVAQHQVGDLVGHLGEQRVAPLLGEVAVLDHPVEQDLDVDLVVGGVDAGRVVDEVGVDPAVALRRTRSARAG